MRISTKIIAYFDPNTEWITADEYEKSLKEKGQPYKRSDSTVAVTIESQTFSDATVP